MSFMNDHLREIFAAQEKEDMDRMTVNFSQAVRKEFHNMPENITGFGKSVYTPGEILAFSIKKTLVRVSSELSLRKHTLCQVPYYHTHDFYELIYVYQGRGGQYLPDEKEPLEMGEGDLCLLTPGKIHAMMPASENDIVLKLILPGNVFKGLMERFETDGVKAWAKKLLMPNELYRFPAVLGTDMKLKLLMEGLLEEMYRKEGCQRLVVDSLLNLLFVSLERTVMEYRQGGFLYAVSNYIRKNLPDACLKDLADEMGYSPRHMGRKILEASGGSFSDLLTRIRLQRAAELLQDTHLPVEAVAKECGYQTTSGFYKGFIKIYGMAPGEYRARALKQFNQ